MLTRVLLGAGAGLLLGAVVGYVGRCRNGRCPLTSDPFLGSVIGAVLGALLSYSLLGAQLNPGGALMAAEVNDAQSFEKEVLRSDKPVLVDFYATWCMPCKTLAPVMDAIAREYEGQAKVVKVDIDKSKELVGQYGVRVVPTVVLFHQGKQVQKWTGAKEAGVYRQALDRLVQGSNETGKEE